MINSKAIFDVLKKIVSRSSEIRRSDPLPHNDLHIFLLVFSTRKEAITIMGEAKHLGLTGKSYVWIATQAVIGANLDAPEEFPIGNIYK